MPSYVIKTDAATLTVSARNPSAAVKRYFADVPSQNAPRTPLQMSKWLEKCNGYGHMFELCSDGSRNYLFEVR